MPPQTYENTVGYAVAGKNTGGILSLKVAEMVLANVRAARSFSCPDVSCPADIITSRLRAEAPFPASAVLQGTDAVRRETEMVTYVVNCTDVEVEEVMDEYSVVDHAGDTGSCYWSAVTIDNKWPSQLEAILNIGRTLFVTFILGFGALLFSRDANSLVLHPLERMVQKVTIESSPAFPPQPAMLGISLRMA